MWFVIYLTMMTKKTNRKEHTMQHLEAKLESVVVPISASALSGILAYAITLIFAV